MQALQQQQMTEDSRHELEVMSKRIDELNKQLTERHAANELLIQQQRDLVDAHMLEMQLALQREAVLRQQAVAVAAAATEQGVICLLKLA